MKKSYDTYMELQYNAYNILKDYFTIEDITNMPIRDLYGYLDFYTPKLEEIAKMRTNDALKKGLG